MCLLLVIDSDLIDISRILRIFIKLCITIYCTIVAWQTIKYAHNFNNDINKQEKFMVDKEYFVDLDETAVGDCILKDVFVLFQIIAHSSHRITLDPDRVRAKYGNKHKKCMILFHLKFYMMQLHMNMNGCLYVKLKKHLVKLD